MEVVATPVASPETSCNFEWNQNQTQTTRFPNHIAVLLARQADYGLLPKPRSYVIGRHLDLVVGSCIANGMAEREVYSQVHGPGLGGAVPLADDLHRAHCDNVAMDRPCLDRLAAAAAVVGARVPIALRLLVVSAGYKLCREVALPAVVDCWAVELGHSS